MKIAILLNMRDEFISKLKESLPNHEIVQLNPEEDIKNDMANVDIIVGANVEDKIIKSSPNLKLFQVPWVGVDRLNFRLLEEKNIPICNSKWNNRIVAEYAITLLLTLMKHLIPIHNEFIKGTWVRSQPSRLLTNSSVLLIGYGAIGIEIAKLLQPFTNEIFVIRNNPRKDDELVKDQFGWDEYNKIINKVDVVINSLPLTPDTENILNEERIKSMPERILLINVGRGKTINELALFEALKLKRIAGAGLDVWYQYKRENPEPFYPSQYPFHELDNVIMSPHRAASFNDTPNTVWEDTIYNVKALEEGKELKNKISYELRY